MTSQEILKYLRMQWLSVFGTGPSRPRSRLSDVGWRYGLALLFVGLAFGLRSALQPALGTRTPFGFFLIATVVATWWGGRGPGILALVAGYLTADWFFVPPLHRVEIITFHLAYLVGEGAYLLLGGTIVLAVGGLRAGERRTRAVSQRLETTLAKMPAGVLISEAPSGRLTYHNEQAEKICGKDFIARGYTTEYRNYQGFHPDGRPYQPHEWPVARSLAFGEVVTDEIIEFPAPDGRRLILSINSAPMRDPEGNIHAAVISFSDISARQEAEDQLEAILQNASAIIFLVSARGRILRVNRHWEKVFQQRSDEVQGRYLHEVFPAHTAVAITEENQQVLSQRTALEFETEFLVPGDGVHTLISTKAPLFDSAGNVRAIVGVSTDITERKKTEAQLLLAREQLSCHAEELEREVADRTAHLEETVQSLEGVCYHIAHDLRAPLRAIQGFSSMLLSRRSDRFSEIEKDFLERIGSSALRMDGLIHDLLEYGRLGHAMLPCSWVKVDQLLKGIVTDWAGEIQSAGAKVEMHAPLPEVWANPQALEQILVNLLSNALKYVAPGVAPHVQIWADERERDTCICVQDNGVGIEPNHHEKIFRVFERLYPSEQDYPGTGIGLAIVQKGVQRMGGHVSVRSAPGRGSCFCVTLPKPEHPGIGHDRHSLAGAI